MKAISQDRYGSPSVLHLTEVAKPAPGDDDVLVKVHAATANARDWHLMRGDPYLVRPAIGLRRPKVKIRGTDFAGRVVAVGANVSHVRPGDDVFGEVDGAFAEYVRAPGNVVERMPAGLTYEQAAALPLAANTALVCLRDGQVEKGQHVLINGASGGVGTFAIQIAREFGAYVTAVCSTRNVDLARSLGADAVVDYTVEDFTTSGERYDVVLDLVGNHSLRALRRVLMPAGKLVLSGGGVSKGGSLVGPMGLYLRGRVASSVNRGQIFIPVALPSRKNLATLRELVETGKLTPVIDRTYPFSRTAEAIRYLEDEHARAKVVITVNGTAPGR